MQKCHFMIQASVSLHDSSIIGILELILDFASNFCLLVPLLPFKPHIIVLFSPLIYFSILFPNYIYTFFHLCLGVWGCIIRGFQLRRCYSAQHGWVSHQSRDFSTRQSLVRNLLRNMAEIGRGQRSEWLPQNDTAGMSPTSLKLAESSMFLFIALWYIKSWTIKCLAFWWRSSDATYKW